MGSTLYRILDTTVLVKPIGIYAGKIIVVNKVSYSNHVNRTHHKKRSEHFSQSVIRKRLNAFRWRHCDLAYT